MSDLRNPAPAGTREIPVMLTPIEYWKKKWGRKVLVYGGVILVMAGLAVWFGPKIASGIAAWRARKLVEFAEVQKKAGNTVEMKSLLLQAYGLARNDPTVLHAMADNYASSAPEALQFLQLIALRKEATREDRLKLCRAALNSNLLSYAKEEFERLIKDPASKKDPEAAELVARYFSLNGEPQKALAWTASEDGSKGEPVKQAAPGKEGAPSPNPGEVAAVTPSSSARLNLMRAKLLLEAEHTTEADLKKTGADVVVLLSAVAAQGNDKEQRDASLLLARLYVVMPVVREAMGATAAANLLGSLDKWKNDPLWETNLGAADLQIELKPESRDSVIAKLAEDARKAEEQVRLELARWFNSRKETRRAEEMAAAPEGNTKKIDWFLIRMDAMAAQNKWQEIKQTLVTPESAPINDLLKILFLWRCAKELKEPAAEIEKARAQILEVSRNSTVNQDFFVAAYLEKFGEWQTAAALYQKHTEDETIAGPAYVGLARCLSADPSKTSAYRDMLEKMLVKYPNVSEARNDLAYLNLLEGRKLNESTQAARILVADSPGTLAYMTTMALAELRRGNFQSSDAVYQSVKIDWDKFDWGKVNTGWKVVRAAVLGANGKEADAKKIATLVDASRLREGERKLLEQFVYKTTGPVGSP